MCSEDEPRVRGWRRIGRAIWTWCAYHPRLVMLIIGPPLVVVIAIGMIIVFPLLMPSIPSQQQGDAFMAFVGVVATILVVLYYVGKFLWWLRYRQ